MEVTAALIGPAWQLAGAVAMIFALALAARRAPWRWLVHSGSINRYAAASACVLALWQLRASLDGGPALHLLGATLLTLAFGWQLAFIALSAVLAACALAGDSDWLALGVNTGVNAFVPVAVSYAWARFSEVRLPGHLFVFIFSAGFFGAMLAVAATAFAAGTVLYLAGLMGLKALFDNYLPATVLLLFPEAFLTGGMVTLAAVYRPHWLVAYDDSRFIDGR